MAGRNHTPQASEHVPVMLHEVVKFLAIRPDGLYLDATYGRGGHSAAILAQLGESGRLRAFDKDPEAVADAQARFSGDPRFSIMQTDFAELARVPEADAWMGQVDGLLLDLGVSSPQLDVAERGFGFMRDGDLDMRMDPSTGQSASQWLALVSEAELEQVFREFGEERFARRISRAVVRARAQAPITRTIQLAEIIKQAHPRWERHHHPATRCFQAIRIKVNNELESIRRILKSAAGILREGGRLCVISFHSLEDRLVKQALRRPVPDPSIPRHLPQPASSPHPWKTVGKAIRASAGELSRNPRARSAVLRVAERVS